jgi:hypothetical protein
MRKAIVACAVCALSMLLWPGQTLAEAGIPMKVVKELQEQIHALRKQMDAQREAYEAKLGQMQNRLDTLSQAVAQKPASGEDELKEALNKQGAGQAETASGGALGSVGRAVQSMNPQASVIIDTIYYSDDSKHGFSAMTQEMAGFGHSHGGDDEHSHEHGLKQGFNLRHLELAFSAEVDPYFKGYANVAVTEDNAEIHEAYIDTSALPWGFKLRAGKFFSNFSRINHQHTHEWDFVDAPLIYTLTLGDHRLLDKGLQLSWLAPTPFHLLFGVEALQGDNEMMFNYLGGSHLPEKDGPRLWVGWLKYSPNLPGGHGLEIGPYFARGVHQEEHDGNGDGIQDHWLSGHSQFYGVDLVYKYDSGRAYGEGDLILQADYFRRKKDLSVEQHDLAPAFIGKDRIATQDGYYVQGVYGFLPRWRAGLRWEQVGLTNEDTFPDDSSSDYDASWRLTGMVDFSPSHFSRLRLQSAYGSYAMDDGTDQEAWQLWLQLQVSLGTHGAHKF